MLDVCVVGAVVMKVNLCWQRWLQPHVWESRGGPAEAARFVSVTEVFGEFPQL